MSERAVLDASAVLALLYREPGAEVVAQHLDGAILHTVNLAEVLQKIRQRTFSGRTTIDATSALEALGVVMLPTFTKDDAARTAEIWALARQLGLSLGDQVCLATVARWPGAFALTADAAWTDLPAELGIEIRCIR